MSQTEWVDRYKTQLCESPGLIWHTWMYVTQKIRHAFGDIYRSWSIKYFYITFCFHHFLKIDFGAVRNFRIQCRAFVYLFVCYDLIKPYHSKIHFLVLQRSRNTEQWVQAELKKNKSVRCHALLLEACQYYNRTPSQLAVNWVCSPILTNCRTPWNHLTLEVDVKENRSVS